MGDPGNGHNPDAPRVPESEAYAESGSGRSEDSRATTTLVVGLGNPGLRYARTRHNVGFMVVEEVARRLGAAAWVAQGPSLVAAAHVGGLRAWLARPTTFMNRSGEAVEALLEGLRLEAAEMVVVVDDIDLPLGRLRLRSGGGPGTHNGLRDIVGRIGTGFPRLRVGVRGEQLASDLADYVLADFGEDELERAGATVLRAAEAVECALEMGLGPAMDRFNRAPAVADEEPAPP